MNISFELYRIFNVVAKLGSISRASEELLLSQPAVSISIKKLEEQLGGDLFIRTKEGVVLTTEGKIFHKYIKQAIETIYNAESKYTELINLETGSVKVGSSVAVARAFLLPYFEQFQQNYPKIDINIETGSSLELISKLKSGSLDIIFINSHYERSDIEITKCFELNDCFAVGKKYQKLCNKQIKLESLNKYPLMLPNSNNFRYFINNFFREQNVILKPKVEFDSYDLIYEFTKHGFGIGYLTKEYIKTDIENGDLFILDVHPKFPSRFIGLAVSKDHTPNFSTKKLIEMIVEKNNY